MTDRIEDLEKNGHDLTFVSGPLCGISMYYCERCGALARTSGALGFVSVFHIPPGSPSTWGACVELPRPSSSLGEAKTLKQKLEEEWAQPDHSRLRARE